MALVLTRNTTTLTFDAGITIVIRNTWSDDIFTHSSRTGSHQEILVKSLSDRYLWAHLDVNDLTGLNKTEFVL